MSYVKDFVAGGLACMSAAVVTTVPEVVKTTLQMQGELATSTTLKYRGVIPTMIVIAREEGVLALWKGLTPSLLREATYSTSRLGFYKVFRDALSTPERDPSLWVKVLSGAGSGALGSAFVNPCDLLRVRYQAGSYQANSYSFNVFAALSSVYRTEGMAGLYVGVVPTVVRAAILTSSQLSSYDESKATLRRFLPDGFYLHTVCALISGITASVCSNPMDVVKSRIMADTTRTKYSGMMNCIGRIHATEGAFAFFKGLKPTMIRIVLHTQIMIFMLEKIHLYIFHSQAF